jgi:hypothetical protein
MSSSTVYLSTLATELQLELLKQLLSQPSPGALLAFLYTSPVAASIFRRYGEQDLQNQLRVRVATVSTLSASRGSLSDRPNYKQGVSFRRWKKAIGELAQWIEFGLRWVWASGRDSAFIERLLQGPGPCLRRFGSIGLLLRQTYSRKRMLAGTGLVREWAKDADRNWVERLLFLRKLRNGKVRGT